MASKKQRLNAIKATGERNERAQAAVAKSDDSFLKDNSFWDELNEMSVRYYGMLRAHAAHSVAARNKELMTAVQDKKLFLICLQGLTNHLRQLSTELSQINSVHAKLKGGCTDHTEVMLALELFDRYSTFLERHDAILMPTTQILTNLTTAAEQVLIQEGKTEVVDQLRIDMNEFVNRRPAPKAEPLTPEQDPNVVTDIEVK